MKIIIFGANEVGAMIASQFYTANDITVIDEEKNKLDTFNKLDISFIDGNASNIDILKVGHHGSKTSSGYRFINKINPKYSLISVGQDNKFGHPNKEVLDNLNSSKVYRTDMDGSIMFKIRNNKLKIGVMHF